MCKRGRSLAKALLAKFAVKKAMFNLMENNRTVMAQHPTDTIFWRNDKNGCGYSS